MTDTQLTKTCSRCGHPQTFFVKTWEQMEWGNGKRRPTKHRGCGGDFVSSVGKIGGRS